MDFARVKYYILNKLERELSSELSYHNLDHTLDVYNSVLLIAENENITGDDLTMLRTAALFHDSGMLVQYVDHEEASAEMARSVLPRYGYSSHQTEVIGNMIIATKLPQGADTFLAKILCDADLDYLGREDYIMVSHRLRHEWNHMGVDKISLLEWYRLQTKFLEEHEYFTECAKRLRRAKKEENLNQIKELLNFTK